VRGKRGHGAALMAVLAAGLALRLWGIGFGLPERYHPDEAKYVWVGLRYLSGDLNPHYFLNPPLWSYVLGALFAVQFAAGSLLGLYGGLAELAFPSDPSGFFLLGRVASAVVGTATVWVLYRVGAELFSPRTGLLAALLLAVAFLHVRDSHYAVNDVPAVFLLVCSFLGCVRIYRDGRLRDSAMAGAFAGLAVAAKYSSGMVLAPLVLAQVLHARRVACSRPVVSLAVAGVAGLAAFLFACPWPLLDPGTFARDFLEQVGFGKRPWARQAAGLPPVLYLDALVRGLGVVPLALAAASMLLWARDRDARGALVLVFPLLYLGYMSTVALFYARFALPALPFLALAAASALDRVLAKGAGKGHARVAAPAMALAILALVAQPLVLSLRHNQLLARADTRQLLTDWAVRDLPVGSTIAREGYTPTLVAYAGHSEAGAGLDWGRNYRDLERRLREAPKLKEFRTLSLYANRRYAQEDDLAALAQSGIEYVVVSSFAVGNLDTTRLPFHRALHERATLVHRVFPFRKDDAAAFRLDDLYSPFAGLFHRERPGPELRIYRLPHVQARSQGSGGGQPR
jgi:4-amino-4-deoxy-L-arabinose transferase-like glycosyltransferase